MVGFRLASQRVMARAAEDLTSGRATWFISLGSSMTPAIRVVQKVALRPVRPDESLLGLVVLARVGARFWLDRVTDERPGEMHIAANNGMVSGWTPQTAVFGVLC